MLNFFFYYMYLAKVRELTLQKTTFQKKSLVEPTFSNNEISKPTLRRLSKDQYQNIIREHFEPKYLFAQAEESNVTDQAILESELVFSSQLEPDLATEGLYAIGSSVTTISPIGVERYEQSAFNISEQVVHFLQESDAYHDLFFSIVLRQH